jgi:hypothetical protein
MTNRWRGIKRAILAQLRTGRGKLTRSRGIRWKSRRRRLLP